MIRDNFFLSEDYFFRDLVLIFKQVYSQRKLFNKNELLAVPLMF